MSDTLRVTTRFSSQQNAAAPTLQPGSALSSAIPFTSPMSDFVTDNSFTPAGVVTTTRVTLSAAAQTSATLTAGVTGGLMVVVDDPYFVTYAGAVAITNVAGTTAYGAVYGGALNWGGAELSGTVQFMGLIGASATFRLSLVYPFGGDYVAPAQAFSMSVVTW